MDKVKHISRYPGIRSYEENEELLFFGRSQEIEELYSLVKVRPLVVLFGKSGLGKSSLINAALIPRLRKSCFLPLRARFQDLNIPPADNLKRALEAHLDETLLMAHSGHTPEQASLWEYVRACRFEINEQPCTPVLILDQFEEFFSHGPTHQQVFVAGLGNLIHGRLPEQQQEKLLNIPRKERTLAQHAWFSPINIKILVSIRSDRLSELDGLSSEIPTILHSRLQLKPMDEQQAREAILEPALLTSEQLQTYGGQPDKMSISQAFRTGPFTYDNTALEEILTSLSDRNGRIETFQLQIVCQHIEEQVWIKQQT